MMDECVGHMTEKVVIPPADQIEVVPRQLSRQAAPGEYCPTRLDATGMPAMVRAGDGYRFHTTGLTHDERGYPVMTAECQEVLRPSPGGQDPGSTPTGSSATRRSEVDGADVVVVAYGITARVARMGGRAGAARRASRSASLRLVVVWPFPETRIRELAGKVKAFVVPEINFGQMVLEVERCAARPGRGDRRPARRRRGARPGASSARRS